MPRHASYHRIRAKRSSHAIEEDFLKRKKQAARPSSSVSDISALAQTTVQRAKTSPQNLTPLEVRQLQATIGNHALSRMVAPQTARKYPAVSSVPVIQRTRKGTPIAVKQSTASTYVVQRWKWPWRRNETDQQKLERYANTKANITTAIDVLRVGHGLVMLPLTVIDLLSNIARPFTGNKARVESGGIGKKEENRKVFHNVLNGESMLVSLMAGKNAYFDLKFLKYMPWNVIPWIIGALNRWYNKIDKKYRTVNKRVNNINDNLVGNGLN